jgi:hypothetical protein
LTADDSDVDPDDMMPIFSFLILTLCFVIHHKNSHLQ